MSEFDYTKLLNLNLPVDIYGLISSIYEFKGKQELYAANFTDVLEKMVEVAKIQSTKSSNAIEGILTSNSRLEGLMMKKTEPRNRNEEELYGYRAVLDLVHENYEYIEFNINNILALHNRMYSFSNINHKGKFKNFDSEIIERDAYGNKRIIFQPVSSFETKAYMDSFIESYQRAAKLEIPPLLLIPTVIHDFLCIHPFSDGNGRLSRVLTLLLLYKYGFFAGKYLSLEMLIEESKEDYYRELNASSKGWMENKNDVLPFIKYMLSIIYKAYKECDDRFKLISEKNISSSERVMKVFEKTLEPLSKSDLVILCPEISKRTIERALKELQDTDKIQKIGQARATRYVKKEK